MNHPTTFLGQDLVYWTGMIAGAMFIVVIVSAFIKQFNFAWFEKYQLPISRYHHWLGWLSVLMIVVHTVLAVLQFNFQMVF